MFVPSTVVKWKILYVRELHFQRGTLNFSVGAQPLGQGPLDADAASLQQATVVSYFA